MVRPAYNVRTYAYVPSLRKTIPDGSQLSRRRKPHHLVLAAGGGDAANLELRGTMAQRFRKGRERSSATDDPRDV
jgi:hypothetical protein